MPTAQEVPPAPASPSYPAHQGRAASPARMGLNAHPAPADAPAWTLRVVETVKSSFLEHSAVMLSAVRRTEDSLKRLKRGGAGGAVGGGSSGGAELTDGDKIRMQLELDVEELNCQVRALGIQAVTIVIQAPTGIQGVTIVSSAGSE